MSILPRRNAVVAVLAALAIAPTSASAAKSEAGAVHPLTTVDEVVDAVAACVAATDSRYVNLATLAGSGWKITEVNGDPAAMAINNYNKRGSNADIVIIALARNPGSLQCSAVGRFSEESSFAELDGKLETQFTRAPDRQGSDTQETGDKTTLSFWDLEHNSVQLAHFYGRNSVMITVRYR